MEHLRIVGAPPVQGAYSHAVVARDLIFTAGMGPLDVVTGEIVGSSMAEQTAAVLANLSEVLRARGRDLGDVIKATVHLADLSMFKAFDEAYRQIMPQPYPARTTVGSSLPGILVEIDFIALA
jgi:2-iminobutanoate/2-iminopropanoate deaminase